MKHLQLKETPKPKVVLHSEMIRNKALLELQEFAFYEAELLYKLLNGDYPNYGKGEEVRIPTSKLIEDIVIGVRMITEVIVTIDKTIIVVDANGDEWEDYEMRFDDVVKIVRDIEKTYNKKIGVLD